MVAVKYISAKEAAEKWGVSLRYVQRLLSAQRIPGARKYQRSWLIPADADKPEDLRKAKKTCAESGAPYLPYRTPLPMMTDLYTVPGNAEAVLRKLGPETELAKLCGCQLAFYQGKIKRAQMAAKDLIKNASCLDTRIGAGLIFAACVMYSADVKLWKEIRAQIAGIPCGTTQDRDYLAFCLAGMDSAVYGLDNFPDWFQRGDFGELPFDSYPLARIYYLKYLLIKNTSVSSNLTITAVAEPLISQTAGEGVFLSEIYQRLLAAIGYHDRGEEALASIHVDRAIELALPDKLYEILAEFITPLDFLLLKRLRQKDPAAFAAVSALNTHLLNGWTKLHNHILNRNVKNVWTIREREVVKLAVYGLTNKEIAGRLHISINTVKQTLHVAMEKVGAKKRTELAAFI